MADRLLRDALAINSHWMSELDMASLVERQLADADLLQGGGVVDVVAIGKASLSMVGCVRDLIGARMLRHLVITDDDTASEGVVTDDVIVGDHPVPSGRSLEAGRRLVRFLDDPTDAACTLFLISGGASSLCALPEAPVGLDELGAVWRAALRSGVDITTLNRLRAATSSIAGGAVLRHVRTARSLSLIMVDNVVSGAAWVASGLTYDFSPDQRDVVSLLEQVGLDHEPLADVVQEASARRRATMARPITSSHENRVVAEPSMLLDAAIGHATRLGYRTIDLGASIHGEVSEVVAMFASSMDEALAAEGPVCVLGVGEVTVQVRGPGVGGRCQDFAWRMADVLEGLERPGVFVASSSDGRDYVRGVAGAWVDHDTKPRALQLGVDWRRTVRDNDSYPALAALGQIIKGVRTGWNLCDLYLALF